jgi:hypothetical protein
MKIPKMRNVPSGLMIHVQVRIMMLPFDIVHEFYET